MQSPLFGTSVLPLLAAVVMAMPTNARPPVVATSLQRSAALTARTGTAHAVTDSADVAQVVTAFHAALAAGDSVAAMALLSVDAVIQESGGVETRSDYEAHHLPGDIRFARALPGVRSAQRVVVVGDVAWSSSTSATKGTYRDRVINSVGAELMVLSRQAGAWRIRAIHWSSRTPRS
jgi:ketosteroid isomerase-like protein